MKVQSSSNSLRDRFGVLLRDNRFVVLGEVFLLLSLVLAKIQGKTILFLFIGWLSLWLRKSNWKNIGMNQPLSWRRTIFIGFGVSVVYQLLSIGLLVPFLHQLTNTTLDLSQFDALRGNYAILAVSLVVSWTLAAFGEEMAYRGYILNRLADLFGKNQFGWAISVIISSILFGLGHLYQGIVGIAETFVFGFVMACLYLVSKRNLWLPILVHGMNDTIGFLLIFLSLYP